MMPEWFRDLFTDFPCTACRTGLQLTDIQAVGVQQRQILFCKGYVTMLVETTCPACGQHHRVESKQSLDGVIDVVRGFGEAHTDPTSLTEETLQTPLHGDLGDTDEPIYRGVPRLGAITEQKARRFISRLKRTSFKRNTKTFRRWMKQLGVDPDEMDEND